MLGRILPESSLNSYTSGSFELCEATLYH